MDFKQKLYKRFGLWKNIMILTFFITFHSFSNQIARVHDVKNFTATYFGRGDDYIYEVNNMLEGLMYSTNTGIKITVEKGVNNYNIKIENAGEIKVLTVEGNLSYALASILFSADFLTSVPNSIDGIIVKSIYELDQDGDIENIATKSSYNNHDIVIADSKSANVDYTIAFKQYAGFYKPGFLFANSEYNSKLLVVIHHKPSLDLNIKKMMKKVNNIKVEDYNNFDIETEINKDVYFIYPPIVNNNTINTDQYLSSYKIELGTFNLSNLGFVFNLSIENVFKGKFSPNLSFNFNKFPDKIDIGNKFLNNTLYSQGSVIQYEVDEFDRDIVLDSIVLEFPLIAYDNTFHINPLQIRNLSNLMVDDNTKLMDLSDLSILGNSAAEIFKNTYANGSSNDDPNDVSMLSGLLGCAIPSVFSNASYFSIGVKSSLNLWASIEFYLKFNEEDQLVFGIDPEIGHSLNGEITARYVWKPGSAFYQFVNNYIWGRSKNGEKSYIPLLINSAFNIPKENGVIDFNIPNLEMFTHETNEIVLNNNQIDQLIENETFKNAPLNLIGDDDLIKDLANVPNFTSETGLSSDNVYMLVNFMEESSVDQFPVDYANENRLMFNDIYQNKEYNVHYHFYFYEKTTNRFLGQKSVTHSIYETKKVPPSDLIGREMSARITITERSLKGIKDGVTYFIPNKTYIVKYKILEGSVAKNPIDLEEIYYNPHNEFLGFTTSPGSANDYDKLIANNVNITDASSSYGKILYRMNLFSKGELKLYDLDGKTVLHMIKDGTIASEESYSVPFYQDLNMNKRLMTNAVYRQVTTNFKDKSEHSEFFNTIQNPYPDPIINIENVENISNGFNISLSGTIKNAKYFSVNGDEYYVSGMEQDKTLPWDINYQLNEYALTHELNVGVRNTKCEVFTKIINPIPHITINNNEKAYLSINDAKSDLSNGEKLIIHGDYLLNEDISFDGTLEVSTGSSLETNGFEFDCENVINDDFVYLNGKKLKDVLAARRMAPVLQLLLD